MSKPGRLDPHEITYVEMDRPEEEIIAAGRDAKVILIDAMGKCSGHVIESLPELKMIHSEGVGYQGVDIEAAAGRNIPVCNCKGMNALPVAEHAVMLMLGCLRNIVNGNEDVLAGRQIEVKEAYMKAGSLRELADCKVGLVGFGDIARETARLLQAFGAECIYYNRSTAPKELEYGAVRKSLEEVLEESDIISLHLPVTAETRNICNDDFFGKVKKGAIFINTARGDLVDSESLIRAMEAGRVSQAGLDCLAGEPVSKENVLVNVSDDLKKRIIFSPHIAGITASSFRRGYEMFWENVDRIAKNEKPERVVNGVK